MTWSKKTDITTYKSSDVWAVRLSYNKQKSWSFQSLSANITLLCKELLFTAIVLLL